MNKFIFEKERVKNFNDAVFSIAMTLLILEIAIPSARAITEYGTIRILKSLMPSFIGLLVSFLVIALYWVGHLRTWQYVKEVTNRLLWINIFLLLFIVLLPFSTAFYVSGISFVGPFIFYCINLTLIGLFNYLMISNIVTTASRKGAMTKNEARWNKARALNPLLIWILAGLMALVFPNIARFTFFLIFIIQPLIDRYYKKRAVAQVE